MAYRASAPDLADRSDRFDRDRMYYERDRDRYGDIRERFEEADDHVYSRRADIPPRAPPPPLARERDRSVPRYRPGPPYEAFEDDRIPLRRRPSPPGRYRSPSPVRRGPPAPRPGMLRRPSSLDTFERKEKMYYERERAYSPPPRRGDFRAPPYMDIPLPRHKALPPPRFREEREREYWDEIRVSDPDRYGDDDFHHAHGGGVVREKKVVRTRRRSRSRESRAARSFQSSSRSSSTSSSSSSDTSSRTGTTITARTTRSEYPKKGKTRVPARLVSRRALIDLEYPFVEEGNTIVIQKALGQQNIDDLLKLSDDYKKSERELEIARSMPGDIIEERRTEIIEVPARVGTSSSHHHHVTFEETTTAAAAVAAPSPAPVVIAAPSPRPRTPTPVEVIQQQTTTAVVRDVSPSRSSYTTSSYTSGPSICSSATSDTCSTASYDTVTAPLIVPVREVSSEVPLGPVAIVDRSRRSSSRHASSHHHHHSHHSHSRSRSRHTRHSSLGGGGELVRAERLSTGELVLREETVERIEEPSRGVRIEKDRRGPPPKLMKAMLATLT